VERRWNFKNKKILKKKLRAKHKGKQKDSKLGEEAVWRKKLVGKGANKDMKKRKKYLDPVQKWPRREKTSFGLEKIGQHIEEHVASCLKKGTTRPRRLYERKNFGTPIGGGTREASLGT